MKDRIPHNTDSPLIEAREQLLGSALRGEDLIVYLDPFGPGDGKPDVKPDDFGSDGWLREACDVILELARERHEPEAVAKKLKDRGIEPDPERLEKLEKGAKPEDRERFVKVLREARPASRPDEPDGSMRWSSFAELRERVDTPISWVVEGMWNTFLYLGGAAKSGKTTFSQWLIVSLVSGQKLLDEWEVPEVWDVSVFIGEGQTKEYVRMLSDIADFMGVDQELLDTRIRISEDTPHMEDDVFQKTLDDLIQRKGEGIKEVVILDPFYAYVGPGYDQKDLNVAAQYRLKLFHKKLWDAGIPNALVDHLRKWARPGEGLKGSVGAGPEETADSWVVFNREEDSTASVIRTHMLVSGRGPIAEEKFSLVFGVRKWDRHTKEFVGEANYTITPHDSLNRSVLAGNTKPTTDQILRSRIVDFLADADKPYRRTDIAKEVTGKRTGLLRVVGEMIEQGAIIEGDEGCWLADEEHE